MNRQDTENAIQKMMADDLELMRRKGLNSASGDFDPAYLEIFGFYGMVLRLSPKTARLLGLSIAGYAGSVDTYVAELQDIRSHCYIAEIEFELERGKRRGRENLEAAIQNAMAEDLALLRQKWLGCADYEDALAHLDMFGLDGTIDRIANKVWRLMDFITTKKREATIKRVRATLRDIRNYCYIAEVLLRLKKTEGGGRA